MNNLRGLAPPFVCLVRHGETEFSARRRYNGVTDAGLTANGERVAAQLEPALGAVTWDTVLSSTLGRARRTAELAGFALPEIVPELRECDYGEFEGLTTEEILERRPGWDFWRDGCPGGEDAEGVAARLEPVIERLRGTGGRALAFSHSHAIRIFAARWLGLAATGGAMLALEPARLSVVGTHRRLPMLQLWNDGSYMIDGGV